MNRGSLSVAIDARKALRQGAEYIHQSSDLAGPAPDTNEVSGKNPYIPLGEEYSFTETEQPFDTSTYLREQSEPYEIVDTDTAAIAMISPDKMVSQPPKVPSIQASFDLLQQWECTVLSVRPDEFTAVAADRTDSGRPDEEVVFDREDVNDADLNLLAPGAVFYWNVGYRISEWGQKTKGFELRFRRLPAWSKRELEKARKRASELSSLFTDDDGN